MEEIKIKISEKSYEYPIGITLDLIANDFREKFEYDIVLAKVDGKLTELYKSINCDCEVEFLATNTSLGNEAYKRSTTLLMLKAFYDVCGQDNIEKIVVQYSLSKGYYCDFKASVPLNQELINRVTIRMNELVDENIPIKKRSVSTDKAIELFKNHKMYDKEKLFKFRRSSRVNLYSINKYEDYYYGYMVPSTKYLKYFKLHLYDEGFLLQLPEKEAPWEIKEFKPHIKLFEVLKESSRWSELLGLDTVGALDERITMGKFRDMILVQEALQEKKISKIAEKIIEKGNVKFVMVAGPSSSGKTTFSHRLSIQLMAHGLKPHPIPIDDYFVNRENSPRDESGDYDYEALEALDIEQLNKDLTALAKGELVQMPTYNFKSGKREYKGKQLQLDEDSILIIEGIHGLNDKLTYSLPKDSKFKIYISALTQLNIDEHNRIPTTDGRLLRRIIRDERTRGASASDTIARWPSVRKGEEKHIFPFQEEADAMFNSALIYEFAILKQYAEPVLFGVPKDSKEYIEAKRLLKFLDYFIGVSSEAVPPNSLLREFIGGGCFNV